MEHTKEPWSVYWPAGDWPGIETDNLSIVLWGEGDEDAGVKGETLEEAEANAHRIVTCVNACAGMADPAAEIEKLRADLAMAVGALMPFAYIADYFDSETEGFDPDNDQLVIAIDSESNGLLSITETRLRVFLVARETLAKINKGE